MISSQPSVPEVIAAMRIRLLSSAALAAVLAVASGCATTSKVMLGAPRAPIAAEQVRIYYTPPSTGYVEIALLETHSGGFTYGDQNKTNEVFAKLRAEAARLGANGVLFQGAQDAYGGGSNVGVGIGAGRYGGHTRIGGGVGVSVSPTPKYARGIAIFVANPPPEN